MEPFLKISARENAAVKIYRKLASSRKERMREQRFVLEGLRLVGDAVKTVRRSPICSGQRTAMHAGRRSRSRLI